MRGISKRIDRTRQAMFRYLITRDKPYYVKYNLPHMKSMRDNGRTFKEIAEVVGISDVHARRLLLKWSEDN